MKTNKPEFIFELYISNQEINGIIALANLKKFCNKYLPNNHSIMIIDVLRQPEMVQDKGITVVPTIIKTQPSPIKHFIGNFSNFEKIKNILGIGTKNNNSEDPPDTNNNSQDPSDTMIELEQINTAVEGCTVTPFTTDMYDIAQEIVLKNGNGPYKIIVETMCEGAVTLIDDGTIIYCNQSFCTLANEPIEKAIGSSIYQYLNKPEGKALKNFINDATRANWRDVFTFKINRKRTHIYFSISKSNLGSIPLVCIIMNDLSRFSKKKEIELNNLINDYNRMNNSLRISVNLAHRADKAKSEFLANMSHELRTPLNSIIGYSEMMFNNIVGDISPKQKQYLGEVLHNSRYLLDLINQVLDLRKIEANQMEFNPTSIDIRQLIKEVANGFKPSLKEKNIKFTTSISSKLEDITIDALKFKQVLYNLLANAVKFSHEKGKIKIVVKRESEDSFRVEVIDTGIGIKNEDLKLLFTPFQRLNSKTGKDYQGTGIGLSLTKLIVDAQGGRVGVNSTFEKGSNFYFILPFKPKANSRYAVMAPEIWTTKI